MNVRRSYDERRETTRDALLAAAIVLMSERGIEAASLADIAERAGVTKGALTHQYDSRDAFLDDVLERVAAHVERMAASVWDANVSPIPRMHRALVHWVKWSRERPPELRVFAALVVLASCEARFAPLVSARMDALERVHAEGITIALVELSVRARVSPEMVARLMVHEVLSAVVVPIPRNDASEMVRVLEGAMLAAIDPFVVEAPELWRLIESNDALKF
jgi:AcrR family transcriptional regulator